MEFTILASILLWTVVTYRPCTSVTTTTVATPEIVTPFKEITNLPTFVDKTNLIKYILDKEYPYTGYYVITCPRGFGKTVNLDMIKKFVELATDQRHKPLAASKKKTTNNYKLFTNATLKLDISRQRPVINEHFGKYATIYFDFNISDGKTYGDIFALMCHKVGELFEQYRWLYDEIYAKTVDKPNVKALFENIFSRNATEDDIRSSLKELAVALNSKFKAPVFVLVDNYDTPIATAMRNGAGATKIHALVSDMMRNLLNNTDGIVQYFVLTGVSSTFANLMTLDWREVKTFAFLQRSRIAKYFGFDDDDMAKLYEKFHIQEPERTAIYQHYGGYRTDDSVAHTHLEEEKKVFYAYNPFAVVAYLRERPEGELQNYNFHTYWSGNVTVLANLRWLSNVFLRDHIEEIVLANRANFLAHMASPGKDLRNLEKMFNSTEVCEGYKSLSYMLYLYDMGYLTNNIKNYLRSPNLEVKRRFENYLRDFLIHVRNITESTLRTVAVGVRNIAENPITTDSMRTDLANSLQHEDILAFAFERDNKKYAHLSKKSDLNAFLYLAIVTLGLEHFANVSSQVVLHRVSGKNFYRLVQVIHTADFLITSKDLQCVSWIQVTNDDNVMAIVESVQNYTKVTSVKPPKYLKYLTINMRNRALQVDSYPTRQFVENQWMVL